MNNQISFQLPRQVSYSINFENGFLLTLNCHKLKTNSKAFVNNFLRAELTRTDGDAAESNADIG